jgi:NADH-quinone oxidoreductase subunit G
MLRGPAGALALSVQLDSGVAMDTIALARATLVQLGVGHGDPLDLEQIP